MPRRGRLAAEGGFTLVEVILAMALLLTGVFGTIALIDGANAATTSTASREAGLNLAREIVEDGRGIAFHTLSGDLAPQLQPRAGLADADAATAGWQVERRGVTYTVTAGACAYDDAKDGLGLHPTGFCAGAAGTADRDPEDYKRVTVEVRWARGTGSRRVAQIGLVGSPGNAAGIGVTSLAPTGLGPADPIPPVTSSAPLAFSVATSRPAFSVEWAVDGAVQPELVADPAASSFAFAWATAALADGTYVVSAQAFDPYGRSAGPRAVAVTVNRARAVAPANLTGTLAGAQARLDWEPSAEGDVVGYTLYRKDAGGDVAVTGCARVTLTACDTTPPAGAGTRYFVVAVDRDGAGADRDGDPSNVVDVADLGGGPPPANRPPSAPATLGATRDSNSATLTWSASTDPDAGDAVAGYRIYHDGAFVTQTSGPGTSWSEGMKTKDPAVTYVVRAVDGAGAESASSPAAIAYPPGYTP